VAIVGIGWNGTEDEIDGFISRHGLTFTNVRDADGGIFASFGVAGQPAWVFQDAAGVREVVIGAPSEAEVDARLAALAG
jgi:peroxiredoxin